MPKLPKPRCWSAFASHRTRDDQGMIGASVPASGWCRGEPRQATKKRGRFGPRFSRGRGANPPYPADPMALGRQKQFPAETAAGRLLYAHLCIRRRGSLPGMDRVGDPIGEIVCREKVKPQFSRTGLQGEAIQNVDPPVRSRRSRLGPCQWIGAKPPLSLASTKASPATIQPWRLSGDTEARTAKPAACGP